MVINVKSKKWQSFLDGELKKVYFRKIINFLDNNKGNNIFPKQEDIFKVFNLEPKDIKVVIIGQDPYYGEGQANGLAFSVNDHVKIPPSLVNIFKEIKNSLNIEIPNSGNLEPWFNKGVFLVNSILTVEKNKPMSHKNIGWNIFFENVINQLNTLNQPIVFLLFGNNAKKYKSMLINKNHLILETSHPSPLGSYQGFNGSGVFDKVNKYLSKNGINREEVENLWKT